MLRQACSGALALMFVAGGCTAASVPSDQHRVSTGPSWRYPSIVEERHSLPVGSRTRTWLVQRPADLEPGERLPVVVVLHGHGATAEVMAAHLADRSATRRLVLVYPEGWGQTWNVGPCCWPAAAYAVDDLTYLDLVLDHVRLRPDVAVERVPLMGGSLGGVMAFQYACSRAQRLSAVVSIAGTQLTPCAPSAPVATMQVHSVADESIAYDGGDTGTEWLLGLDFPAVVPTLEAWAAANGECPEGPGRTEAPVMPIATATEWDCGGTVTRLETLAEGGHAWPVVGDYVVVDQVLDFVL